MIMYNFVIIAVAAEGRADMTSVASFTNIV